MGWSTRDGVNKSEVGKEGHPPLRPPSSFPPPTTIPDVTLHPRSSSSAIVSKGAPIILRQPPTMSAYATSSFGVDSRPRPRKRYVHTYFYYTPSPFLYLSSPASLDEAYDADSLLCAAGNSPVNSSCGALRWVLHNQNETKRNLSSRRQRTRARQRAVFRDELSISFSQLPWSAMLTHSVFLPCSCYFLCTHTHAHRSSEPSRRPFLPTYLRLRLPLVASLPPRRPSASSTHTTPRVTPRRGPSTPSITPLALMRERTHRLLPPLRHFPRHPRCSLRHPLQGRLLPPLEVATASCIKSMSGRAAAVHV